MAASISRVRGRLAVQVCVRSRSLNFFRGKGFPLDQSQPQETANRLSCSPHSPRSTRGSPKTSPELLPRRGLTSRVTRFRHNSLSLGLKALIPGRRFAPLT